jgi:hypothetical protein
MAARLITPWLVVALALAPALTQFALAHPGGLNAQGCHTNRKTGEYHCHRGGGGQRLTGSGKTNKTVCDVPGGYCTGCGCKGGPGYRNPQTGQCVGYKRLVRECGPYPHARCVFENAPGTGRNRECALD